MKAHDRKSRTKWIAATISAIVLPIAAAQAAPVDVIADGLANPRGIVVGPLGRVLVVEAGKGGTPSTMTGHVTEIVFGRTRRTMTFASTTVPTGEVSGPTSIALASLWGDVYVTMGQGAGAPFGYLARANASKTTYVADITGYEIAHNPDGVQPPDSNPYGVAVVPTGVLVVDAAANDFLHVAPDGTIELVATFPPAPNPLFPNVGGPMVQAVPTSIAVGPDGAWYVGELRGFPFAAPSHIWRIEPGTRGVNCALGAAAGPCVDWASGLRHIVSLAFGPDGNLYASQYGPGPGPATLSGATTAGSVVRIDATTKAVSTIYYGLEAPGGLDVGRDGDIYVTNRSTSLDDGQVLRIRPIAYGACFR